MNRYFKWFAIAVVSISVCNANELKKDFFSNPKIISSKEIAEQFDSRSLDMSWQFGKNDFFHFTSKKNEVYFEIMFDKIPDFYGSVKESFIEESYELDNKKKKYYIFSCEWNKDDQQIINKPRKQNTDRSSNSSSYLVDKRRVFESSTPQLINENDIALIICYNNILFYTGAGLSVASGVPSMSQLETLLGFKDKKEFIISLKNAVKYPEKFIEKILLFHNACFYNPPTEAHKALKRLAVFKNTKIVTENLDYLHEDSGIVPYRINAKELREEIESSQLVNIDYIICVGLSHDDRGFLSWYKRNNPNGKIISIDLGNPTYLGNEDFIIHEDLQRLLPSIADNIFHLDGLYN